MREDCNVKFEIPNVLFHWLQIIWSGLIFAGTFVLFFCVQIACCLMVEEFNHQERSCSLRKIFTIVFGAQFSTGWNEGYLVSCGVKAATGE